MVSASAAALPAALLLAAAGVTLYPRVIPPPRRGRLRGQDVSGPTGPAAPRGVAAIRQRAVLAGFGAAAAAAVLGLPVWTMVVAAVGSAVVVARSGQRVRPLPVSERRRVAVTLDRFAVCLDSGLSVPAALTAAVGIDQFVDQTHRAFARTAALLQVGADPDAAWRPVADRPMLTGLATAACRSATGGVRLADAVRGLATELRDSCRSEITARAARAGVVMTAPLTLCFLPAFVCLGLAPTVLGLVESLQLW